MSQCFCCYHAPYRSSILFQCPIKFKHLVFTFDISVHTWRLQWSNGSSEVLNYLAHVRLQSLQDDFLSVDFPWPETFIIHQQSCNVHPLKDGQRQPKTGSFFFWHEMKMHPKFIYFLSACYRSYCEWFIDTFGFFLELVIFYQTVITVSSVENDFILVTSKIYSPIIYFT